MLEDEWDGALGKRKSADPRPPGVTARAERHNGDPFPPGPQSTWSILLVDK